jgi:hypothetical protein
MPRSEGLELWCGGDRDQLCGAAAKWNDAPFKIHARTRGPQFEDIVFRGAVQNFNRNVFRRASPITKHAAIDAFELGTYKMAANLAEGAHDAVSPTTLDPFEIKQRFTIYAPFRSCAWP